MSLYIERKSLPAKLKEVYVDFYWSQKKLWALEVGVTSVPVSLLDWILEYPVWYLDPHPIPYEVINKPDIDLSHWIRIQNADLNYPIHIIEWKGRLLVLDGIHRLLKAKSLGAGEIKAKCLNQNHIKEILPDPADFKTGFLSKL